MGGPPCTTRRRTKLRQRPLLVASGVLADAVDHHNQAIFYAAVARSKPCAAAISASIPNFSDPMLLG